MAVMRYQRRPAHLPRPMPDGTVPRDGGAAHTGLPAELARSRRGPHFEDTCPRVAEPTFALAISHTPWNRDRVANMVRMRAVLNGWAVAYREVTERLPNADWSRLMWGWGAMQAATHVVFLQDDLDVAPAFWPMLSAMVRAVPHRVISLIGNHPHAERALDRGEAWWCMCEVLGSGYVIPSPLLGVFLDWRDRLGERARTANEDYLISSFLFATGRKAWCPVPTPIQTRPDHAIASTNPLVAMTYLFRQSYLAWDDPRAAGLPVTDPHYWRPPLQPLDFGFNVTTPEPTRFDPHGLPIDGQLDEQLVVLHHRISKRQGR